jgi:hypothetical protein
MAKDIENTQQESAQQPQVAQPQAPQARPCPQDCRQCSVNQQIFCTTKMLFDLSRSQQIIRNQMAELSTAVGVLQDQLKPKEQEGELSIPFSK